MLKRSCLSELSGDLNSFRLVMRGKDPSSNLISDSVGPSELGSCSNKRAPFNDHPINGKLYYDEKRIQGVEFAYANSDLKLIIGNTWGSVTVDTVFNET